MTTLGVAMRVLFWDCQRWHLLSGHPEKEISEKGKKSKVIPNSAVLFHFSLPPREEGLLGKFLSKGRDTHTPPHTHTTVLSCALKRLQRPVEVCLFSAQVIGFSGLIFRQQRLCTDCRGQGETPELQVSVL